MNAGSTKEVSYSLGLGKGSDGVFYLDSTLPGQVRVFGQCLDALVHYDKKNRSAQLQGIHFPADFEVKIVSGNGLVERLMDLNQVAQVELFPRPHLFQFGMVCTGNYQEINQIYTAGRSTWSLPNLTNVPNSIFSPDVDDSIPDDLSHV